MPAHDHWSTYNASDSFDELLEPAKKPRVLARKLIKQLSKLSSSELKERSKAADLAILEMGISFTIYSEAGNIDRAWPYDLIPRVITNKEWRRISAGLIQRSKALNHFIHDIYNNQKIITDGIVPAGIILQSGNFLDACKDVKPAHNTWAHIAGLDLVRDDSGKFFVLEDNLRVPSGVSYMIENREISKRALPDLFKHHDIMPVDNYPLALFNTLASISPRRRKRPNIVVLTPGIYNSAYFEHAFLAQSMGAELVEGSDLFVDDNDTVFMRTVDGPVQIDVVYRRIDEDFLDPEVFNPDSMIGVPGLMRAWKSGTVSIANAPGAGVADDKVVYAYVEKMVQYYLKEKPILRNVKTYLCTDPKDRDYVLENIASLVVKPANESGGYGIMIGPHVGERMHNKYRKLIEKNPRNYIAQPTLQLSTAPTFCDGSIEPRHLDLRPFVLQGKENWCTAGGLTRVALRKGSLVVNSSQGGGSKDTWIVK
ncbi:MAG: circularly permuted type 2 ATP-grasp protein [Gammaproteobacteria bacterium]